MAAPSTLVFFSADHSDLNTADALERSLQRLLPQAGLEFWNRKSVTDTEYRTAATHFLEKARLAVIVHSDDYQNHPDTRWELSAILAEKIRRPWGIQIAVVQARHATFPPELRRFDIFPDVDEALDSSIRDAQIVRVSEQLGVLITETPALLPPLDPISITLPLTLPDLRERLLEVTDRANLSDVLVLLKTFVRDAGLMRRILQAEDDFIGLHLRERNQLSDYQDKIAFQKERIETLIGEITDEYLLEPGWRPVFLKGYHSGTARTIPAFFLPNEDILVPDTLNLPVATDDAGSAERVGLLSYEQKLEFRRLLLLCQDALMVGKAAHAHGYCEQVRTGIDPQSAQLYEYLLVSFLQKEGVKAIISGLMEGYERNFRHIKLYSDRFHRYQYQEPPQSPSGTGAHNCRVAAEELGAALLGAYTHIQHDAILCTGTLLADIQPRTTVRQCLDAAFALHQSLLPSKVFLESLLLELAGGGKVNWLRRLEVHDGNWQIVSNADFDLPGKTFEMQAMLEASDKRRTPEKQREMLREDLFWGLLLRCQQLSKQIEEEKRQHQVCTDIRQSVIHIIQTCVVGHALFSRTGDVLEPEKSLLRLGIELLLPGLLEITNRYGVPENLHLPWFTLNDQGEVVEDPACIQYQFEARTILEKMVADHAGQAGWPVIQSNIKEEVWQQYNTKTDAEYQIVAAGLQWTDFRKMNALEARKRIISCLRRWKTGYLAYPEKGVLLLDQVFTELAGDGLLLWFQLTPADLLPHPEALAYQYDARSNLAQLLTFPGAWTAEQTTQHLIGNLFKKSIVPEYEQVIPNREEQRAVVADLLGRAMLAFKKHPLMIYLDFVYRELTGEHKLKWINIGARGHWQNASSTFDAVDALTQMTQLYSERFPPLETRVRIADNRWQELISRYEAEISAIRHENRLPERTIVANIIRAMKAIFLFLPDQKYLELPYNELRNHGRIRWQSRMLGIFLVQENHFENALIPFDYKAERVEVQMYIEQQFQLYQQVLVEIGVIPPTE